MTGIEIIGLAGIMLVSQFVKKTIKPKFGATGVHVFTFLLALVWVALVNVYNANDVFQNIVKLGLAYLTSAITVYEVLLKRLGINKII